MWQFGHRVRKFEGSLLPPADRGTTWSTCSALRVGGFHPQDSQESLRCARWGLTEQPVQTRQWRVRPSGRTVDGRLGTPHKRHGYSRLRSRSGLFVAVRYAKLSKEYPFSGKKLSKIAL